MPGLNLTHDEARARAAAVTPHRYVVDLDLTTGTETFLSSTRIEFSAQAGASTFVDLVSNFVHSIVLNGQPVPVTQHVDSRIELAGLQEENVLEVVANCDYMNTGEGLHAFVDPADGLRYCYSQFEVPDARRVFATFEQPDLKAVFEFSVTTPPGWTVFSNSPTPEPAPVSEGLRFQFEPTPVISTYITAIVAGPYVGQTGSLTSSDGREIPLGVYCRQSLAEYLDADVIIKTTQQGFKFFEDAYRIPYPFTKYDQIFVPEYNAGAMENAGCVTFRDQYIFRSKPTAWELENRANTILHELAHMWFGDLVTMKWWDDLWLNESFAEYMSHLALAEATEWTDAWIGFMSRKEWGLNQDQLPSTHPVKTEMRDLEDVEVNFDGITYAKGASVLRQLVAYVGRDNFFDGLHAYLTKHSWKNATLSDLLEELEATSGRDLHAWTKVWLEEAGVTTLRPEVTVDQDGNYTDVAVVQEAFTPGASLRPHRLGVAGYDLSEAGEVVQTFRVELDVAGDRTEVEELVGKAKPALLLVNDGDLAYAKLRLDEDSLSFAAENIDKFSDAVTRRSLISTAWDMTRDGEMPASSFVDLALRAIPAEDNVSTLTALLARLHAALTLYTSPAARVERMQQAAERLVFFAQTSPAESDAQRLLVEAAAQNAVTPAQYALLRGLYDGSVPLFGLQLDLDMQWTLLTALVRGGFAGEPEIAAQAAKDPTLTGEQKRRRALATINLPAVREETWAAVTGSPEIPNDTRWAMLAGFWSHVAVQPDSYAPFVRRYFDSVNEMWDAYTFQIGSRLVEGAFPTALSGYVPGISIADVAQEWLRANENAPAALRRLIIEGQADAERMVRAQERDTLS